MPFLIKGMEGEKNGLKQSAEQEQRPRRRHTLTERFQCSVTLKSQHQFRDKMCNTLRKTPAAVCGSAVSGSGVSAVSHRETSRNDNMFKNKQRNGISYSQDKEEGHALTSSEQTTLFLLCFQTGTSALFFFFFGLLRVFKFCSRVMAFWSVWAVHYDGFLLLPSFLSHRSAKFCCGRKNPPLN